MKTVSLKEFNERLPQSLGSASEYKMKTVSLKEFNDVSRGKSKLFTLEAATEGADELQKGEWIAEDEDVWSYNVVAVTGKGPQGDFTVGHGIEVIDEDGAFISYWTV